MLDSIKASLRLMTFKERVTFFVLVFFRSLSGLLDVVGIALIGVLAGLAATSLSPDTPLVVFGFALPQVSQETLVILVRVVLGVFAIKAAVAVTLSKAITGFLARIESAQAVKIAHYLFTGSLDTVQSRTKGEILWGVMGSVSLAFSGLLVSLSTFITEGILLILVATTFILVDPMATVYVFVYFGLIILVIQLVISRSLKKAGTDAAVGSMDSMVAIDDLLGAYREVAIFRKQDFFVEKFGSARARLARGGATMTFLGGMPRYVVETALMLGVVIFVGFQFLTGQLASGLVVVGVFLTGGVRIMASLLPLQGAVANVKNQSEQAKVAHEFLNNAAMQASILVLGQRQRDTGVPVPSSRDAECALDVVLDNVSFTYPTGSSPALDSVSLSISQGQHVAFIGPSGAGKTTLVDLILGLIEPTHGSVGIGGRPPAETLDNRPGAISYVPQNPGIVSGSIAENVALGIEASLIDEAGVLEALTAANLHEFVAGLPQGIHTSVGSQADALSGGQIQRLGLARAFYEKPRLIVLDEATSALDAGAEALITKSLTNLGQDVTVIIIAHRLSTVQHSDVVFLLEDGRVTASGKFAHLRKTVPMVAEYVRLMSFDEEQV
jgi:ABC-type multidrug transport system fused ATPase/permease subunit